MAVTVLVTYLSVIGAPPRLVLASARLAESASAPELAERLLESVALRSSTIDEEVSEALRRLAELYRLRGRHAEAAVFLERSRFLLERSRGSLDPEVARLLDEQALVLLERGDPAAASRLEERALLIRTAAYGADDARVGLTLEHIAELKRRDARSDEAMRMARRALATEERTLAPDHPHVVRSLARIGAIYREMGDREKAALYLFRALELLDGVERTRKPGEDATAYRYERAGILRQLGILRSEERRYGTARQLFAEAFSLYAPGSDASVRQAEILADIAQSYEAEGRSRTALVHLGVAARFADEFPRVPSLRARLQEELSEAHARSGSPSAAHWHRALSDAIRARSRPRGASARGSSIGTTAASARGSSIGTTAASARGRGSL